VTVLHRVRAHNLATASANKIHDDDVARHYGFAGGLVPGVDVFAYMTNPVVGHFGAAWLCDGAMRVRFEHPVYDGRDVTVERAATGAAGAGTVELTVYDDTRAACARATARLGAGAAPEVSEYLGQPLPDPPPPASAESLAEGTRLGSVETVFRSDRADEYLDAIGERLPLYREGAIAHPGWLLRRANRVLAANVTLGPWIHIESDLRLFRTVRDGEHISTGARVARVWERRGHKFVTLDVAVTTGDAQPVMHAKHTAIYEPRALIGAQS
jgi:acyl dehydratase